MEVKKECCVCVYVYERERMIESEKTYSPLPSFSIPEKEERKKNIARNGFRLSFVHCLTDKDRHCRTGIE